MKNTKTGFSLAELLICLVIAAIIATMGISIGKKGIERSYDAYIFAGYKGISDAISEANADGHVIEYSNIGNCEFTEDILNMLNVKGDKITTRTNSTLQFTTPNNITYRIASSGKSGDKEYYSIQIWFPTPNLKAGEERRNVEFVYAPDNDYGVLIPIPKETSDNNYIHDLVKRKDLLMYYIDDGLAGRVVANGEYKKRDYYSLNDALCRSGQRVAVDTMRGIEINPDLIHNGSLPRKQKANISKDVYEINPSLNFIENGEDITIKNRMSIRILVDLNEEKGGSAVVIGRKTINKCSALGNEKGAIRVANPRQ